MFTQYYSSCCSPQIKCFEINACHQPYIFDYFHPTLRIPLRGVKTNFNDFLSESKSMAEKTESKIDQPEHLSKDFFCPPM
jgi:hypothetical protein